MSRDGMNYAPDMSAMKPVVEPGEFVFAASHFDHGHVYGQIQGLAQAGGILKAIFEPDASRIASVCKQHPEARVVSDFREIFDDDEIVEPVPRIRVQPRPPSSRFQNPRRSSPPWRAHG